MSSTLKKVNIFSFNLSTLTLEQTSKQIIKWARNRKKGYIVAGSMNDVVLADKSKEVAKSLSNASFVTADGISLVLSMRLLKGKKIDRVYGPDLLLEVCRDSQNKDITHFFYGSTKKVLRDLVKNLKVMFPNLKIAGTYSPPFRKLIEAEENKINKIINKSNANIVWVGLGAPKQNLWAMKALPELHPCIIIGVGAAFDFISESKKQAPIWMRQSGLEWLFRLYQEPGRLWKRYIFGLPIFFKKFIQESRI